MYKTLIITALTAAVAMAAPAVHAGATSDRTAAQTTVSLRDIDFQNPAQVQTAYKRVVAAAHSVCDSDSEDFLVQAADSTCERQAVKNTLAEINQPALYRAADRGNAKAPQQFAFNDRR
jgi:UrcA family protein